MSVRVKKYNMECRIYFEKIVQNFQLFRQKLAKKKILANNITARRSTEWCSIDYRKNISFSKLAVETGLKKLPFAL